MAILDKIRGAFEGEREQEKSPGRHSSGASASTATPTSPTSQTSKSTLPSSTGGNSAATSPKQSTANPSTRNNTTPSTSNKAMSDGEQLSWETSGGSRKADNIPDSGSKKMIGTEGAGKSVGSGTSSSNTPGPNSNSLTSGNSGTNAANSDRLTDNKASSGINSGSRGSSMGNTGREMASTGGPNGTSAQNTSAENQLTSRTTGSAPRHSQGAAGHPRTGAQASFDPDSKSTTQDHQILAHKTHDHIRHQEEEEVRRIRDTDRHLHHVQIHEQPLHHREVRDEVHHEKVVPTTQVTETHSNLPEEHTHFIDQAGRFKDTTHHAAKERSVVDLGEEKREVIHHHVHNIIQPVLEREIVDRHRIHTTIPIKHVVHEAPVVHQTLTHQPLALADFKAQGGALGTGLAHTDVAKSVMREGECDRQVSGVGEQLARDLHLKDI